MDGRYREGDHLLGIAGLALLRAGAQRRLDAVGRHVAEIETIARRIEEPDYARRRDLPEYGVQAGYAGWAERYDDPGNDTIALEQPLVRALLDDLPAGGPVLDAAGARRMIPEYAHLHGDYVEALTAAGLAVRRLLEPGLTRRQARARAKGDHPEVFEGALTGVPAVIVWEAERPA